MIRSSLVDELASQFDQLTLGDCEAATAAILAAMSKAMMQGYRIEIRGFGSFSVSQSQPRVGRNPNSGERVAIPARRVVRFKPGKALREAVDQRTAAIGNASPRPSAKGNHEQNHLRLPPL